MVLLFREMKTKQVIKRVRLQYHGRQECQTDFIAHAYFDAVVNGAQF